MPAYVIFERDTGRIVHVHIEPDEMATPREGLLAMVDRSVDRDRLDVLVAVSADLRRGISSHIDVSSRKLIAIEEGAGRAGGGAIRANAPGLADPDARRVYRPKQYRPE